MKRIVYAEKALLDLYEIETWASQHSLKHAERLINRLDRRIAKLAVNAGEASFHPTVGPRLRRVIIQDYEIFFQLSEREVLVVAVLHGVRDLPAILAERGYD